MSTLIKALNSMKENIHIESQKMLQTLCVLNIIHQCMMLSTLDEHNIVVYLQRVTIPTRMACLNISSAVP